MMPMPTAPASESEARVRYAALVHRTTWTLFLVLAAFVPLAIWVAPERRLRWVELIAEFLLWTLVVSWINRSGRPWFASMVQTFSLWLTILYLLWTGGGFHAPAAAAYVVVVLIAGSLLGWRAAIYVGILCSLTLLAFIFAERLTILPRAVVTNSETARWIVDSFVLMMAGGVQYLSARSSRDALRISEKRFQGIFDSAYEFMGLLAPDGSLLEANRTALAAIAARPEDVIGKPFWETPWWKHSPALQQGLRELVTRAARGETVCSEADQWSHDGRQVWVEFTLKPVFDEHGRVALIIPEGRDITERKCAEQALRETVESLQAVFSASPVAIVVSSLEDGNIIEANQKAVEVFGYAREEAIGASAIDLWQDAQLRQTMIDDVKRNGAVSNLEVTMLRKDRELVTVLVSARRVVFRGIERLLTVAEDITERKRDQEEKARLQVQLYQAQKMEAIGRLAAGVAHDFNNLLTVIGGYTEMSLAGLSRENPAYQRLLEVIKASRRAADITHQLLAFSRRQPVEPTFVNLNALIRETEKMLRRLTGEETKFLINLTEAAVPGVRADVGHLVQVLMNLAVNARDAMPEGGLLTIETAVVNVGHEVSGASKLKPGPHVSLRVRDTGTGMDRETLSHIFEPFFTTKADGTGLGLSVVHGIVEQSGGSITVSSQPGIGSMFEILLPMVEPSTVSQERLGGEAIEAGTETVLLVDDDEAVRSFARQVLQGAGYRVVEAAGGMEALAAACSHEGPIDLLVSDLKMPEIGGREVARRLRQERPGLAVLYMSGYSSNETLDAVRADGSAGFIRKPFSPGFLLRRVRRELDGRSPTAS